jgi:hypothetical protein
LTTNTSILKKPKQTYTYIVLTIEEHQDVLVVKAQEKECKKKKNVLIVVEKALKGIHVISLDTMVSMQ